MTAPDGRMIARESVYLRGRRVSGFGLAGAPWRRVGLGEVGLGGGPGDYAMLWSPGAQMMSNGREAFVHDGPIGTLPSHDLTHLIIAANGALGWRPAGERADIYRAEYNVVMLENLYDKIYRASLGELSMADVVPQVAAHLDWFVNKLFVPFPASAKQAIEQFATGLRAEPAVRLSPHFYDMKHAEIGDAGHMDKTWTARFRADDAPPSWDALRAETHRQLEAIKQMARR